MPSMEGPAVIVQRSDRYYAVLVEMPTELRLGLVLFEALAQLHRIDGRAKRFRIVAEKTGNTVLEWLFAREDEARAFAEVMAPTLVVPFGQSGAKPRSGP
jgi:hypothetical protein